VIDAKYRGNKSRFINHGKGFANVVARHCFSRGVSHFAFYAKEDIAPGTELLFDYEGGGSALREQFPWIRQPNPPKNRQKMENPMIRDEDQTIVCTLKTGPQFNSKVPMKFKLNANPKKFLKIERPNELFELREDGEEEYFAYQENTAETPESPGTPEDENRSILQIEIEEEEDYADLIDFYEETILKEKNRPSLPIEKEERPPRSMSREEKNRPPISIKKEEEERPSFMVEAGEQEDPHHVLIEDEMEEEHEEIVIILDDEEEI